MSGHSLPSFLLPQAITIAFTSGIFLGFYLISVAFANRWLILTNNGWSFKKSMHWYTLITTNITAVLVVMDAAVDMSTSIGESEFVAQGNKIEEYVELPWRPILKCIVFDFISLLTDTFLIYRLWNVCARRMSVIWFPCFLWVGNLVCIALQIVLQLKNLDDPHYGPPEWTIVNMSPGPGLATVPFLASTIVLNAYCTGLLVWRIWQTLRLRDSENSSIAKQFQFLIRILMESGVLCLSISIAHFFVYFSDNRFAIYLIGTLNAIVVGIAYNLIIIRVGKNRSDEDECSSSAGKVSTLIFSNSQAEGVSIT